MEFNKNLTPTPLSGANATEPTVASQPPPTNNQAAQALQGAAINMLGELSSNDPFTANKATKVSTNNTGLTLTPELAYRDTLRDSLRSAATESVKKEITKTEGHQIKSELREELTADFMKQNGF